ncbi:AraC family transcriptional regulator [Sporosarcina sp. 179-K 3D1 HS]|uniref:AraC family transcriptional regulator n=1 Tax=Sporosarcina sp. 179-K 3D1 HS TaxID=3232169 RepID=UPI00399FE8CF
MEGLQRMLDSIEYIESNLANDLYMEDIAATACMSKFHFQRMFHTLTGYTASEYYLLQKHSGESMGSILQKLRNIVSP